MSSTVVTAQARYRDVRARLRAKRRVPQPGQRQAHGGAGFPAPATRSGC